MKFKNEEEARQILELVRYANVHKQRPLVQEEFLFIAEHPRIAETILTMTPPKITIFRPYVVHRRKREEKKEMKIEKDKIDSKPKPLV